MSVGLSCPFPVPVFLFSCVRRKFDFYSLFLLCGRLTDSCSIPAPRPCWLLPHLNPSPSLSSHCSSGAPGGCADPLCLATAMILSVWSSFSFSRGSYPSALAQLSPFPTLRCALRIFDPSPFFSRVFPWSCGGPWALQHI